MKSGHCNHHLYFKFIFFPMHLPLLVNSAVASFPVLAHLFTDQHLTDTQHHPHCSECRTEQTQQLKVIGEEDFLGATPWEKEPLGYEGSLLRTEHLQVKLHWTLGLWHRLRLRQSRTFGPMRP